VFVYELKKLLAILLLEKKLLTKLEIVDETPESKTKIDRLKSELIAVKIKSNMLPSVLISG
jgi:hypothetical protein